MTIQNAGNKYSEMGIFKEARERNKDGMGYRSRRYMTIWQGKKQTWQHIHIEWGIRWSDKWQFFPIWNASNNSERSLLFGIWKLYFQISYHRAGSFNQDRKMFLRRKLWKFYQLVS